ncbi:CBS domain-containing protein [Pontibacter arcticus]|uniref:Histidine kinase n=1 Tax=Pontibacter arcticus TaxID=2080288 RepID=A0A364RF09_9BACT|nr:CBS domain-containing protein [Pontibacter arcticus]RAU82756.1 histidine kinase [Pontibacter arcticus]
MGTVRHILQKKGHEIISINPDATVFRALELLVEKNVGSLLVLDGGKLTGIFTERDYARKVILKAKASKQTPIREIMSTQLLTVTSDTTVQDCMNLMTQKFIRHLPVIENNELKGLVSIGDLVKYIIEEQQFIIGKLEHYISGHHEAMLS